MMVISVWWWWLKWKLNLPHHNHTSCSRLNRYTAERHELEGTEPRQLAHLIKSQVKRLRNLFGINYHSSLQQLNEIGFSSSGITFYVKEMVYKVWKGNELFWTIFTQHFPPRPPPPFGLVITRLDHHIITLILQVIVAVNCCYITVYIRAIDHLRLYNDHLRSGWRSIYFRSNSYHHYIINTGWSDGWVVELIVGVIKRFLTPSLIPILYVPSPPPSWKLFSCSVTVVDSVVHNIVL